VGVYRGRLLKGEKAAELAVQQSMKIQLAINLPAAKALGLSIMETLLATADEIRDSARVLASYIAPRAA
jgi:putative tryptophan/tyrosine transport system substrate-binding protein